MRRDGPDPADIPMPPDVFAEHAKRRRRLPRLDPLHPVPRRETADTTSALAAELLAEAADRRLESGELLLVSEEATLADLEASAAAIATTTESPALTDDDPLAAVLASPRLMSPRIWDVMGWQPPLAEHLRMLEATLFEGRSLPQTMLVGHVETFVEWVEHLVRLRDLLTAAADGDGRVVLTVRQAVADDLPPSTPQLSRVLADARPAAADADLRHAVAIARLALGTGVVCV